ncbi:MAG: hypothetical protein PHF84_08505 [bacterium]|nr:hypothetical protein [bacterium]
MNYNEDIYYEYLSRIKSYLFSKIQFILHAKFPFIFEKANSLNEEEIFQLKKGFIQYEEEQKDLLDGYYFYRLKKRISEFEFELLMLLFFNIEDIKFNAIINKIKDPERLPFTEEDYYGISLNEALELLLPTDKEKFILRKEFLLNSYLLKHKIINFPFTEATDENPLIFNENLLLSIHVISKIIHIEKNMHEIKSEVKFANRLKIGEEGF